MAIDQDEGSILTYGEVQELARDNQRIYLYCETRDGNTFRADFTSEIDETGTVHILIKDENLPLYPNNQVDLDTCREVIGYWFTKQGKIVPNDNISFGRKVDLDLRGTLVNHYGPLQDHKQISADYPIHVTRVFAIDENERCLLAICNTTDVKEWYIVEQPADRAVVAAELGRRWQQAAI